MNSREELYELTRAAASWEAPFEHLEDADIADAFVGRMDELHPEDRGTAVQILFEDVLSEKPALAEYPHRAESLLRAAITRWPNLLTEEMVSAIIREATRTELMPGWAQRDGAYRHGTYDRKQDYSYALFLWGLLDSGGRKEAEELYQHYRKRLLSSWLIRAIDLAKDPFGKWQIEDRRNTTNE